jgi:hypothetical protein
VSLEANPLVRKRTRVLGWAPCALCLEARDREQGSVMETRTRGQAHARETWKLLRP